MLAKIWGCLLCSQSPLLVIRSHSYSIVRLLGDGGYAYVYLVKRDGTDHTFALKKIRCMFGGESVANAMREVEACHVFKNSDRIISCIDSTVTQEEDGTKTVYIVLPYYSGGNLQDLINENMVNGKSFSEAEVLDYSLGIAEALKVMHTHRSVPTIRSSRSQSPADPNESERVPEQERLLSGRDDDNEGVQLDELVPYAHRDIKPGNVMIKDAAHGTSGVVLIDLGSCSPARVDVETRRQALEMQDIASEHCTLPYRAPELFDVRTGIRIDEKVDIWGLGCTIYALMYSVSPFEREEQVAGANINIAIARGKFSFPSEPNYSESLKGTVSQCLQVDPSIRPPIDTVIQLLTDARDQVISDRG